MPGAAQRCLTFGFLSNLKWSSAEPKLNKTRGFRHLSSECTRYNQALRNWKKKKKEKTHKTGSDFVYLNATAYTFINLGVLQALHSNDVVSDIRRNAFAFYTVKGNLVQNDLGHSIWQHQQLLYLLTACFAHSYMTGWQRYFSKTLWSRHSGNTSMPTSKSFPFCCCLFSLYVGRI